MSRSYFSTDVIIISGLRCVGKTTLLKNLSQHPKFRKIDKFTTRLPRANESSQQIFVDKIPPKCDFTYELYENSPLYGFKSSEITEIIEQDQIAISDIMPVRIIKEIKELYRNSISILIERDLSDTEYRLISRQRGYSNEQIENQLIQRKIQNSKYNENKDIFDHIIQNNGTPLELFSRIQEIIKLNSSAV